MSDKIQVLVIFANPRGTDQLNLGREDKVINEAIRLSRYRDNFDIDIRHAATVHDLRRAMLDKDYKIVHISGHGTGSGLVLEDDTGGKYVVPQRGLANLFGAYSPPFGKLECVILNACFSIAQGELTSLETPFTIAMEGAISDSAAIEFSRGFYDAIGANKDIDFAYAEGCRNVELSAPNSIFISKILRKGEKFIPDSSDFTHEESDERLSTRSVEKSDIVEKSLIGIAIDVSGSMSSNIRNNSNKQLSRLESFGESLNRLGREAKKTIEENRRKNINTSIDLFAYAFGLRSGQVCDLLSLMRIGKDIISKEEIEELKNRYVNEMKRKYESYSGLGGLARQFGFGDLVNSAEETMKRNAEQEIRRKIMLEVRDRLEKSLKSIGDTTLPIHEVADISKDSEDAFNNAEELIFGMTPMKQAFEMIVDRFKRELSKRPKETVPIMFIVSDGDPTDGDPTNHANELKNMGVTIVSCYVTDKDLVNPKILLSKEESGWDSGAKLMFNVASVMEDDSNYANYLLKNGWTVNKNSRMFVQINHSSILEEFINVVLSPMDERNQNILPMGI